MLVRGGVAGCILGVVVLLPFALPAAGIGRDAIGAVSGYALLGVAVLFLAWEALLVMRKRPAQTPKSGAAGEARKQPANVDDMVAMLGDALTLARSAPAVERLEPIDVPALLRGLLARMGAARVSLADTRRPMTTLASRPALVRALEILVENALASGSRVAIWCDAGTCALAVHVDDDGPGIPRSVRAQVLEWHYYMATPPSDQAGCKAEVVIARQIAKAHGGDVVVACSPLGGARFTLRLPLLAAPAAELAAAS